MIELPFERYLANRNRVRYTSRGSHFCTPNTSVLASARTRPVSSLCLLYGVYTYALATASICASTVRLSVMLRVCPTVYMGMSGRIIRLPFCMNIGVSSFRLLSSTRKRGGARIHYSRYCAKWHLDQVLLRYYEREMRIIETSFVDKNRTVRMTG